MESKKLIVALCSGKKDFSEESHIDLTCENYLAVLPSYQAFKELQEKVCKQYFSFFKDNVSKRAIDLYTGKFYNAELKEYIKSDEFFEKFDMLIVSTLYGVVHFKEIINSYEVGNMKIFWKEKTSQEVLRKIILEYYKEKKFHSMHVFLSKTYFNALKLEQLGDDNSIFCYIALDGGGKRSKSVVPQQLGEALYAFLKGNKMENIVVRNPLEYDKYHQ